MRSIFLDDAPPRTHCLEPTYQCSWRLTIGLPRIGGGPLGIATSDPCAQAVADCIVLVVLHLTFFSLIGVLLFSRRDEGMENDSPYFDTLPQAMNALLILLTTANFPDVMLNIYMKQRSACFFFILFLLLGLFLLMNLVLAAVFRNYKEQIKAREDYKREQKKKALDAAFLLLDLNDNGFVMAARLQPTTHPLADSRSGFTAVTPRVHSSHSASSQRSRREFTAATLVEWRHSGHIHSATATVL